MSKQIVLCDLIADNRTMTTWLDRHPRLAEGAKITLADYNPEIVWVVKKIYESPQPHFASEFDFHRKWDNNNYDRHKGLGV